jgi:hypothetical protein
MEMKPYVETVKEKNGKMILMVKREILATSEEYSKFLKFVNPLIEKLRLKNYVQQKYKTKQIRLPGMSHDIDRVEGVDYVVDCVSIHMERVKAFFHADTTKDDVASSLAFLIKNGWTEKEFQTEIGINRATLFHYLPKTTIA